MNSCNLCYRDLSERDVQSLPAETIRIAVHGGLRPSDHQLSIMIDGTDITRDNYTSFLIHHAHYATDDWILCPECASKAIVIFNRNKNSSYAREMRSGCTSVILLALVVPAIWILFTFFV